MNKNYCLSIALLMVFCGCLATMPPAVKDDLLTEKTADEAKKMNALEERIVVINQENNKVKEELKITKQRIVVSGNQISSLEEAKKLALEKEKLYAITGEADKLADVRKELQDTEEKLRMENAVLSYLKAKQEHEEDTVDLKDAELASSVAELYHEKAVIARRYQDKVMPAPAGSKDADKNKIDVPEYEKYLNSQKERLANEQKQHGVSMEKLKQEEVKLKASGYEKP